MDYYVYHRDGQVVRDDRRITQVSLNNNSELQGHEKAVSRRDKAIAEGFVFNPPITNNPSPITFGIVDHIRDMRSEDRERLAEWFRAQLRKLMGMDIYPEIRPIVDQLEAYAAALAGEAHGA